MIKLYEFDVDYFNVYILQKVFWLDFFLFLFDTVNQQETKMKK